MKHARLLLPLLLLALQADAVSLHPAFPLLDASGKPVLSSGRPASAARSCSACHDTEFISRHSSHSRLGPDSQAPEVLKQWLWDWEDRHPGGGVFESIGMEHDCFLCHLKSYDFNERSKAIHDGRPDLALNAGLQGAGLLSLDGSRITWNRDAFDSAGNWPVTSHPLIDPDDLSCGRCHSHVHAEASPVEWPPDRKDLPENGMIWSPQRVSASALNLESKDESTRSWDIHAERLLACTSCHHARNHPAYRLESAETRPEHLIRDGRRMDISEYLNRPLHNLETTITDGSKGRSPILECATCHDSRPNHDWLPFAERHMNKLNCEACHIPVLPAGVMLQRDLSALDSNGRALESWRGNPAATPPASSAFQPSWEPVLLENGDGRERLHPVNLLSTWRWESEGHAVPMQLVRQAWEEIEQKFPGVFDTDGSGSLSDTERILGTEDRFEAVAGRLRAAGVADPRIHGSVDIIPLYHGVTGSGHSIRSCEECHMESARLDRETPAWSYRPWKSEVHIPEQLQLHDDDSGLVTPNRQGSLYVLGADEQELVDWLGLLSILGVVAGGMIHGSLRILNRRKGAGK